MPTKNAILTRDVTTLTFPFPFKKGTRVYGLRECRPGVYQGWAGDDEAAVLIAVPADALEWML